MSYTSTMAQPKATGGAIFADPTGRRWNSFVVFVGSVLATVCFLSVILGIGALSTPELSLQEKITAQQTQDAVGEETVPLLPSPPAQQPEPTEEAAVEEVTLEKAKPSPTEVVPPITNTVPVDLGPEDIEIQVERANPLTAAPIEKPDIDPSDFPSFTWLNAPPEKTFTLISGISREEHSSSFFPTLDTTDPSSPSLDLVAASRSVFSALGSLIVSSAHAEEAPVFINPRVFAVLDNGDPQGMASVGANADKIDVLLPRWIFLAEDGDGLETIAKELRLEEVDFTRERNPDIQIAPIFGVPAYDDRQVAKFTRIISLPATRSKLVQQLVTYIKEAKLPALTLSFDSFEATSGQTYMEFVRELHSELMVHNLGLFHILANTSEPSLLTQLSNFADALVVQLELEHSLYGDAGPLASQDWFNQQIRTLELNLPLDKVVIAMRSEAFNWREDNTAQSLTLQQAYRLAELGAAVPATDPGAKNSTFNFVDREGVSHTIWMLDAVSAYQQLQSVHAQTLLGFAIPRLGVEDASIWQLADINEVSANGGLLKIDTSEQIHYLGEGEVYSLSRIPQIGQRELIPLDDDNGNSGLRISQMPNGYEVLLSGPTDDKVIALTFDDGPTPRFTRDVLDILSKFEVPGTFFALGDQMVKHPELIERMLDEGHNVGSHTFSHINISSLDPRMLNLELNSTQAIFESITGRNLALFRAPFSSDAWPVTVEEIQSLITISDNGYLSVGANVDTRDWDDTPTDEIVRRAVSSVRSGVGQIIMLHDGGGDRTATVQALPQIITQLKQDGYRFISMAEYLGQTADDIMPTATNRNTIYRAFVVSGFQLIRWGEVALKYVFLLAIILGCLRALFLIGLSFKKVKNKDAWAYDAKMSVGVVIPAYNEVEVIVKTVNSVLRSSHKNISILVVDDGSTDDTFEHCRQHFLNHPKVEVVTQTNAGKSEALNFGFSKMNSDIVVALDADTVFDEQAIPLMMGHFSDPEVAAVSGNAKVGNRTKTLTKWQALEYIVAQNLDRRAFEYLNSITVVPGAVGAWRRSAVMEAGGFGSDTLAEDADLTVRLLRAGHRIKYEEFAIAYTEAPETVREFSKQRLRWMFGMMQVGIKNLSALKLRGSKSVGLVAVPNILIFQILFPLIAPIADFAALCVLATVAVKLGTSSSLIGLSDTLHFLALFGAFIALDFLSALVAFWHEKDEDKRLLWWLLPQRFFYRQLIYIAAIQSIISAIRGEGVTWGHLRRTGSVVSPAE